jgi:mannose-6-phosphate isomerase-like protein (cupin superfamily)
MLILFLARPGLQLPRKFPNESQPDVDRRILTINRRNCEQELLQETKVVAYTLLDRNDLPRDGHTYEFQGYQHGETAISFIWVDMPPGEGVRLHEHPYQEVFLIQEGRATFTIGSTCVEAQAGQIIILPGGTPHKFINSGERQLRQIDIHLNKQFITEWLED